MTYGDGCTGWPDEVLGANHRSCCGEHDLDYEQGSDGNFFTQAWHRIQANYRLGKCVGSVKAKKKWHQPLHWGHGVVMGIGTQLFGAFYWRWNGWEGKNWGHARENDR